MTFDGNQAMWNKTELHMGSAGIRLQLIPALLALSCGMGGCRRNYLHVLA